MRRSLIGVVLLLAIGAAIAWLLLQYGPGRGASKIEQWVGRQLQSIANDSLRPAFAFQTLDYEYPATVTLHDVTLTDGTEQIVRVAAMRIVFTERPQAGRPVVIQTVELTDPVVRLIQREEGGLVGFSNLIESAEGQVHEDGGSARPSDVFAIRRLAIVNGRLEYDAGRDEPMRLDGLTFDLTSTPETEAGLYAVEAALVREPLFTLTLTGRLNIDTALLQLDEAALNLLLSEEQYRVLPPQVQSFLREHGIVGDLAVAASGDLPLTAAAEPALDFHVSLRHGLATFGAFRLPVDACDVAAFLRGRTLRLDPVTMDAFGGRIEGDALLALGEAASADFSMKAVGLRAESALRDVLVKKHEIHGELTVTAAGTLLFRDPSSGRVNGEVSLRDGTMVFGEYRLPVEALDLSALLADGVCRVEPCAITTLGGTISVRGQVEFAQSALPAELYVEAERLRLEEALRQRGGDEPPEYAGRVKITGEADGDLSALPESLNGAGEVTIREGRLVKVPLISSLMGVLGVTNGGGSGSDTGSAQFTLHGDHVDLRSIDVVSATMAARGQGEIYYDSTIDFRLNAGQLEKMEDVLGKLGEVLGSMTDTLVKYHVTGTLNDPQVQVKPLGIGAEPKP